MQAKVFVTLKNGVHDPQGEAVLHSLGSLGHREVESVRIGKYIELEVNETNPELAKERIANMCESLLANTVIESYRIEL